MANIAKALREDVKFIESLKQLHGRDAFVIGSAGPELVLTPQTYAEKYGIDPAKFTSWEKLKTPDEIQWDKDYAMAYIELEEWLKE